jgi:hypothetical protein
LQLPNSVFKGHLKPKNTLVAKVTITGVSVPPTAIEAVMARIYPLNAQWKWEALSHDAVSFLVNFPSVQDLDRVTGIQMGVPDFDAQFKISKCEIQDIQPKFDLPQLWVHVEGVPHSLRHFHGLWAIGSLLGTTVDVDLPTLYNQNVVRVLVAMMSPDMLNKHQDEKGHIVDVTVTLKLQGYDFRCRKQKAGFQPDSSYSPLFWRGKEDGLEEEDPNTANGNGSLPLLNGASSSQVLSMDIDGARSSSSKASMQASMTVDGAAIGGG